MTPTEWLTAINTVLVFVLVIATVYYASQTRATVDELREARIAETLPLLHWQTHPGGGGAGYEAGPGFLRLNLRLLLTNYGRAAARVLAFKAEDDQGTAFEARELAIPSTLPSGERIELRLVQQRAAGAYPDERKVTITLRYTDAYSLRTYETKPLVIANWSERGNSIIKSIDADERSPAERRVQ